MCVGEVHAGGRDVVQLLTGTCLRLGDVDDVQDLGTAEAGDLHSTQAREARGPAARAPGLAPDRRLRV
jgi:hypothetical protein